MIRFIRIIDGVYQSLDGRWCIHRETYYPRRWYVRWRPDITAEFGDAEPGDGFRTLGEAKKYISELGVEPD